MRHRLVIAACAAVGMGLAASSVEAVNVLTRSYDNARTGANTNELTLTASNVTQSQFGKLWSYPVDGHVYAQPLIVQGLSIGGRTRNVVYLATMHNTVYAYDADDPASANSPLWSVNFGAPVAMPNSTVGSNCGSYRDIFYELGILSTPVIDLASNTIYVESKTNGYVDKLHALDLTTGAEKLGGPVTISANLNGRTLQGQYANQRTSLVLANGRVYLGFGGYCDTGSYYGWYFSYSASNLAQAPIVFNAGYDGSAAPVWMAGGAAPVDAQGNLYVMTGNGTFNANTNGRSYGESFLKLSSTLTVVDWFTPYNYASLNSADVDLGSSGPILIPNTSTIMGGGKEGKLYLVNTGNMGHFGSTSDSQILQSFKALPAHLHGGPVYWNSPNGPLLYVMGELDSLKGYLLSNGVLNTTPFTQSSVKAPALSMPGGILAVSSNGSLSGSGIVWANVPLVSDANQGLAFGVLRAFNASNLTQEIWNSQQNPGRDALGLFAKFAPPTVANGKVYMSSFSKRVSVFGLLGSVSTPAPTATPTTPPSGNLALGKTAAGSIPCTAAQGAEKSVNGSVAGGGDDKFCSGQSNRHLIVDLGRSVSIGSFTVRHAGAGGESTGLNTKDFNIQLSADAQTWITVVTVTGNTASATTHAITAQAGRYVRLNATAPASTTDTKMRIYELEVYAGTGATPTPTPTPTSTATPTATSRVTPTARPRTTPPATPTPTVPSGQTAVNLSAAFNVNVAYSDGTTFPSNGGIDGVGSAYSSNLLGVSLTWSSASFSFGTANQLNGVRNATVPLPAGQYTTLLVLGTGVNGDQTSQTVRVNYTDGTSSTFTQTFSNWLNASQVVAGQSIALTAAHRNKSTGVADNRAFNLYGYSFALTSTKTVSSLVLPANNNVSILAATLRN